jgi:acetyltransferase-like isoleucine patch superfamily enzyme
MNLFVRSVSGIKGLVYKVLNGSLRNFELQPNITLGKYTYGFENIRISWGGDAKVVIGSFTSIAANLQIQLGGNHNSQSISTYPFGYVREKEKVLFGPPIMNHPLAPKSVNIGNDVWIGNNVTIMGGARIGDGAIIAMNSHVVGEIGPYEVCGGNPARKIRDRFSPEITKELCELRWWEAEDMKIEQIKHLLTEAPSMHSIQEIKAILGNRNLLQDKES